MSDLQKNIYFPKRIFPYRARIIRRTVKIGAADVRFRVCTNFAPRAETRAENRACSGIGGNITKPAARTRSAADPRLCRLPSADGTQRGASSVPQNRIHPTDIETLHQCHCQASPHGRHGASPPSVRIGANQSGAKQSKAEQSEAMQLQERRSKARQCETRRNRRTEQIQKLKGDAVKRSP